MKKIFILTVIFLLICPALNSCVNKDAIPDATVPGITDAVETEVNNTTEITEPEPEEFYDITTEIMYIKLFDGYMTRGRLTLPGGSKNISKLVIFVNGSGPNTYANHRTTGEIEFNYFDFWADEFSSRDIAFFSYNTRGVYLGSDPPYYVTINEKEYKNYLPSNSIEDIYYMINAIKENERLKSCKVLLLGWSEGAIIAPLVAEKYPGMVDGLFLAGYANDNLKDIVFWQYSGENIMLAWNYYFGKETGGRISREEYEAGPVNISKDTFKDTPFETYDVNNDGYIDAADQFIRLNYQQKLDSLLTAIENNDDEWLKNNYGVRLTSGWFSEHFNLRSAMEVLPDLDLPIYIFQGTIDINCGITGAYAIKDKFAELNKNNLTVNIFEGHDHDLNWTDFIFKDEISAGIQTLIDTIDGF